MNASLRLRGGAGNEESMGRKLLLAVLAVMFVAPAHGETLGNIRYQGRLSDAGGQTVPDGMYTVTLRLYDREDAEKSQVLWKDTLGVQTRGGRFQAVLGTSPAAPLKLASDRYYWVGTSVGNGSELKPRQILLPEPALCTAEPSAGAPNTRAASSAPDAPAQPRVISELRYGNNSVNINAPKLAYGKDQTEAGNKRILFPENYFNNPPIVICTLMRGNEMQTIMVAAETRDHADVVTGVWNGGAFVAGGYVGFNWMAIGW